MKIRSKTGEKTASAGQPAPTIMVSSPNREREVKGAGRKRNDAAALREKSLQAALLAVERLSALLSDPEASNADALKAATLIFERVYPAQAGGGATGDYDICVKEE